MNQYITETRHYYQTGWIETQCAALTFFNNGTGAVLVNNFPLAPGASLVIQAEEKDFTNQSYQAVFALGFVNDLIVIMKRYVNIEL